jgi:exosortase/archaeosortase family protein
MKKEANLLDLAVRYLLLIGIGLFHNVLFYFIFTPLTLYPVYFLLDIFFNATLKSNVIFLFLNSVAFPIELIGSCIAGSAYYLLFVLNIATPKIQFKKRMMLLLFSFSALLLINLIRIFSLAILYTTGTSFFDITHKVFWYLGSTIFVAGIWFLSVKLFKVKEIPFYSDIKSVLHLRKDAKKPKSSKKH